MLVLPAERDDPPERRTASATLRAVSDHGYFFVEQGADVSDDAVDAAMRAFEDDVWPTVTGAFGEPPAPGVDGDPRLALLHANLGTQVGGYVTDEDAYPTSVVPTSNQREMVYLDVGITPGSDGYARVLAHELQHVIQRGHDVDEEAWVNEGLSEVAARLVSNDQAFFDTFLERPDTQLNAWAQIQSSGAHYGASSLFFDYLFEQTDGDVLALTSEPASGVEGVRAFLEATGEPRSFAELVADWTVANLIDEPGGPYGYGRQDPNAPPTTLLEGR
ncbi:MAG: hypothetical protein U1B78_04075, partial [Dehalococcoidia bacterium]|nr:hypothetical protein [Dehalococcoidia bacterium]